jgi:hypothetical protein
MPEGHANRQSVSDWAAGCMAMETRFYSQQEQYSHPKSDVGPS